MTTARRTLALAVAAAACHASTAVRAPESPQCATDETRVGARCMRFDPAIAKLLASAAHSLDELEPEKALADLDRATAAGPRRFDDQARYYELLGIAHGFLGHRAEATRWFEAGLAVDPASTIPYSLPSQITFLYEEARRAAAADPPPTLHLNWPARLLVDRPIDFDVSVLGRVERVRRTRVYLAVGPRQLHYDLEIAGSQPQRLSVPALAASARAPTPLRVFVVGYDADGNEVSRWGSPRSPHEIAMQYDPPTRWYQRWWVWAIIGSAVVAATGTTVYLETRGPSPFVPVRPSVQ